MALHSESTFRYPGPTALPSTASPFFAALTTGPALRLSPRSAQGSSQTTGNEPPRDQNRTEETVRSNMTCRASGVFPAHDHRAVDVRRMLLAELRSRHANLADDAVLAAHELFSNAVRHGSHSPTDTITVTVECSGDTLRIGVRDGSPHLPRPRAAGSEDTDGRGLRLVEALTTVWGTVHHGQGKTVWFTIAHTSHASPATDGTGTPPSRQGIHLRKAQT
ncbi:ATP-binding protein [Streptomyces sp. NPDC088124]|uniref:ATP-binding protein n=1 Tax=Streptomyces sp. NPDC088124 TaxID=3154654 RepID=UPI003415C4A3